jgi:hypothetical protein
MHAHCLQKCKLAINAAIYRTYKLLWGAFPPLPTGWNTRWWLDLGACLSWWSQSLLSSRLSYWLSSVFLKPVSLSIFQASDFCSKLCRSLSTYCHSSSCHRHKPNRFEILQRAFVQEKDVRGSQGSDWYIGKMSARHVCLQQPHMSRVW